MSLRPASLLLLVVALAAAGQASARSTDRNKPMDLEAGHQTGTLQGDSVSVLSNGVHITQGTLDITSSRAEITMRDSEIVRAVFTGAPVVMKQQMDDGTPMTARAAHVDYNLKTEIVVFTGDVTIQQPRGTMSGQRVVYNLKTGNLDSGGEGNGRVKMRILPKAAQGQPAKASATPAAKN